MPRDSSSIDQHRPPETTDRALAAVRDALELYAIGASTRAEIRCALHSLCACARREQILPERLLVRLKVVLNTMEAFEQPRFDRPSDLRSEIIALAIDVYFSDPDQAACE